ncbi:zonadhesin-like isoform X1 [Panthera pardus]|uniref:Zonadhesin-like isoform X1 n=3 Tax=Panthera pardus TaxID=9691 RepID=A0A9W2VEY1_PANPR|nr:zonadhesin-like isoform X1 [Panthera pardus]
MPSLLLGYYCPGGAWTPTPLSGPWGDGGSVGHICPESSQVATSQTDGHHSNGSGQESHQERTCPPSHYCPQGTGHIPFPCPQDMSSPWKGQSPAQSCWLCFAGAEVTHPDGGIHAMAGGPCPPGHFCPVGTAVPLPCPVGTFSDRMFLTMASECLSCPFGHFCGASGLTAPSGPCSPGYFCMEGVSSPTPAGHAEHGGPCPQGHFCPSGTSLPHPCPAGSYSNLTGQASCFPCPAGYYCPENITTYSGHPCPTGFYCPRGTKYATQFPCPRGYYNPDPMTQSLDSCLPCPPGHYCGQENLTQASGPCDAGWFCVSAAWTARPFDLDNYTSTNCLCPATATGGKCPAGSFCPEGSSEPMPCPPGSFCATSGLSTPSGPCQAGYFCAKGAVSPAPEDGLTGAPCPPGTFCPAASHRPKPCPAGTFSGLPEQTMPSACQSCPRSFYCKEAGLQAPSGPCPAGYYCDSSAGPIKDFSLYPCPQGYYCPLGTAMATHHRCPVGTYGPRRGLRSIAECQLCPAGKFCALAGLAAPTGDCAAGHWCKGGATSKDPTDGARGLLCPAGHYCLEGAPVPTQCPPGTWSEEGNKTPEGCQDCSGGRLCSSGHLTIWPAPCHLGVSCTGGTAPATPMEGLSGRSCPPGHVCPLGMVDPTSCPPGSYTPGTHTTKCYICPSGHYCVPGLRPQLCPRGFYCPEGTGLNWQPCPPGTYGPVQGLSSLPECQACDRGRFCPSANATEAGGQCWEGFFCSRGSTRPNPEADTEEEAGPCPQGHYCPRGSAIPQPCPPGTFSTRIKLSSEAACSPCPPGHYCGSAGLTSPSGPCSTGFFCRHGAIVPNGSLEDGTSGPCPAGHFCPPGTVTPRPCPAGTYNSLASQGHCESCPEGFFCPANTSSVVGNKCPAGHYCPASTSFASQFPCPRGTYKPQRGGAQQSDCTPCEPGSYCLLPGLVAVSGPCSAGFHCTQAAAVPNPTDGITGDLCPPGHFCPKGSPKPTPCPPGSGKPFPDGPCSAGYYCPLGQTSATPTSFRCPRGFYCPEGSPQPRACENGTFQPQEAKGSCEPCPAGFYCEASGTGLTAGGPSLCLQGYFCPPGSHSATAHPCPRGTFGPRRGASAELDCELCPAGMFCSSEGLSQPSGLCHSAHYCTGGAVSPTPLKHKVEAPGLSGNDICPPGFFCPRGTGSPMPCLPGSYSSAPGLASEDQCQPCPPGHYCSNPGLSHVPEAELCDAGYICLGGSAVPSPSDGTHGYRCPPGFHCPSGAHSEQPCEPGTFSPLPGADTCLPCPGGTYCQNVATVEPTTCPKGHYCPGGTPSALPCPEGTLNLREGALSPRACQPCPAGRYCPGEGNGQTEGPCSAGYYCEGGASSPTPQRNSAFPLNGPCPRGHYCPQGTLYPVPCPMGTTRSSPGTWSPLPCPPGTFTPQDASGLQEEGDCSVCPPGNYCRGGQVWGKCPAGYYCPPGASELITQGPRESQTSCPQGQLCAKQCPPGFYCPEGSGEPTLCPPHTMAAAPGAKQQEECGPCPAGRWCKAGDPATHPCPAGHYCPGGSETSPGTPQACPEHTYLPAEGGRSLAECLPCPPGYLCVSPGLSSLESHLCPPGYWCPGDQGAFLCPPGTFRTKPGASSKEDCELCPPGHYCPQAELKDHANVFVIPCRAGFECPAGAVAEVTCRAGSYCETQTGIPPLCPGGYACPAGSSTYTGPGQLCLFPYYCPLGTAHPHECPGGSEALNRSGLRVSEETCCHLCEAGTYRSLALDSQACQPCPPGFSCHQGTESYHSQPCPVGHYCPAKTHSPRPCPSGTFGNSSQAGAVGECLPCPAGTFSAHPGQAGCLPCGSSSFSPPGASHCTCRGLNRVFQKSDGSCICQAGHESYSRRGLESEESDSDEDCQPQVAERCSAGEVRLAATRKCVSPQLHNCSSFCHPVDGKLSAELGICQCQEYVSAEELCDAQCLAKAPQLSLAWGSSRELILSVKGEAGDHDQREVSSTLGPDHFFQENARVHLVQCGPRGIFGFVISRVDMLDSFLLEPPVSSPWLQRYHRTAGLEHSVPQDPGIHLHIPNPVVCLKEGDVILFQLHILPHNRSASHYPVYQMQHLFNSNPNWDFGAFRRLSHLVRETHLNFSRFAHQFLDPGTYVFRDNRLPESIIVVLVKKKGVACDPGLSPVQPSSPYQLARHGVLRHRLLNLGPDWTVITGVLLAVGLATVLLTGLGLVLRPSLAQACPVRAWRPQWRGLGESHVPAEYVPLRDSLLSYEELSPWGSREGADSKEKVITWSTGEPLPLKTLEDFSVRTLYDKLEDQSLHVAAQLSKHRSEALAFYRGASQQLQGLKDFLQHLSTTEWQALDKGGDPEMEATAATRTDTEQSVESWGCHTASLPREPWQHPLGRTPSVTPLGFQLELDRVIVALASALSHAHGQPAGANRKASVQVGEQPLRTYQQNPQLASNMSLQPQPPPPDEENQSTSSQQDLGPGQLPQCAAKGGGTESPGSRLWIIGAGHRHGAFPEMQRKICQVENTLDELNEEFFQLTAQALELQKEKDKPGQLPPSEGNTFVEVPSIFPYVWQEDRPYPPEVGDPDGENLGTRALKREEALMLGVRRAHLAQRIEDLEWELSLLLQVADGSVYTGGSWPSLGRC